MFATSEKNRLPYKQGKNNKLIKSDNESANKLRNKSKVI